MHAVLLLVRDRVQCHDWLAGQSVVSGELFSRLRSTVSRVERREVLGAFLAWF